MSDFSHSDGKTQALHPQAHASLSCHDHTMTWARQYRGVAVRHRSASSSLNPWIVKNQDRNATWVWDRCLRATLVYSEWVGMAVWGDEVWGRCGGGLVHSCPPLWMSGIIRVIVYGSHAQTQSLFSTAPQYYNDTAQACHTACTSEASALDYRGLTTTLHRSLEAMPAVSGFSINSDGIY